MNRVALLGFEPRSFFLKRIFYLSLNYRAIRNNIIFYKRYCSELVSMKHTNNNLFTLKTKT